MAKTYRCPKCESDDTASFEMIYASGTQTWSSGGLLVGSDEDLHVGIGGGATSSRLAATVAPPEKQHPLAARISTVVGAIGIPVFGLLGIGVLVAGHRDQVSGGVVALLFAACCAMALVLGVARWNKAIQYNNKEWALHYKKWQKWWLCKRCGERFVPRQLKEDEK